LQAAPPKTKYIEHILVATHAGEAGVGEVFRALQHRLHDSTWTVVFKSLITVHLMIREGSADATLAYLAKHRNILAVSMFSDGQWNWASRNIAPILTPLQLKLKVEIYATTRITFRREHGHIATRRSTGLGQRNRASRSCPWTRAYSGRPRLSRIS
jgi:hypothetical protein